MMLSIHELWLLLFLEAVLAIAGTLLVAYVIGFPGEGRGRGETMESTATGGPLADPISESADAVDKEESYNQQNADETWYVEAVDLAGEVRKTASRFDRPADPDQVSRRLLPLSARIRGHVRSAPSTVETDVYRRLHELAVTCQRVAVEHRPFAQGRSSLEERLVFLQDEAGAFETRVSSVS